MKKPDLRLEEIHRQAKGNPIIELSIAARTTGKIPRGKFGQKVLKYNRQDFEGQEMVADLLDSFTPKLLVLCGYNHTRVKLNNHIRGKLDFTSDKPESGDRVICLRNNHKKQIFNGMLGTLKTILGGKTDKTFYTEVEMDGEWDSYSGTILAEQFGNTKTLTNNTMLSRNRDKMDLFDFGYALTVHKAQGSQAPTVLLFEERFKQMTDRSLS